VDIHSGLVLDAKRAGGSGRRPQKQAARILMPMQLNRKANGHYHTPLRCSAQKGRDLERNELSKL
jgi:hypothetical protein